MHHKTKPGGGVTDGRGWEQGGTQDVEQGCRGVRYRRQASSLLARSRRLLRYEDDYDYDDDLGSFF